MTRRAALVLCALAWLAASASPAAPRTNKKKPAGGSGPAASLSGTVTIAGRIKKVRKAFNPYANIYGGGGGVAEKRGEEPGHLAVYLEGDAGAALPPAAHAVLNQRGRQFTTDLLPVL